MADDAYSGCKWVSIFYLLIILNLPQILAKGCPDKASSCLNWQNISEVLQELVSSWQPFWQRGDRDIKSLQIKYETDCGQNHPSHLYFVVISQA